MEEIKGYLNIDYTRGDQSSYRGVVVKLKNTYKRFYSKIGISYDYIMAYDYLIDNGCKNVTFTASVNQFLKDGDGYFWMEESLLTGIPNNKEIMLIVPTDVKHSTIQLEHVTDKIAAREMYLESFDQILEGQEKGNIKRELAKLRKERQLWRIHLIKIKGHEIKR